MTKTKVAILGASGSVGQSALSVIREYPDLQLQAVSVNKNLASLQQILDEFSPQKICVGEGYKPAFLQSLPQNLSSTTVLQGQAGLLALVADPEVDIVVLAISGIAAIEPLIAALQAGKQVALANKESMVVAGQAINNLLSSGKGKILPLDSEHNALSQCFSQRDQASIKNIYLTASGGPFAEYPLENFSAITPKDALKHPNWEMGHKITIDSATMMNKCLEIIEAYWLFQLPPSKIKAILHPQSIVHGLVEFQDGNCLAHLAAPDMRYPIAYALNQQNRLPTTMPFLDWGDVTLQFKKIDVHKFPTINFAYTALAIGGGAPACLNGANDYLVRSFLNESVRFTDIFAVLQQILQKVMLFAKEPQKSPSFLWQAACVPSMLESHFAGEEWAKKAIVDRK